jgi:hypothetical protein
MKKFNLKKAKAGHPLVTRDGRKARIICFDRIFHTGKSVLVGLILNSNGTESSINYLSSGKCHGTLNNSFDLFMEESKKFIKKKGWINIYKYGAGFNREGMGIYDSKEEAISGKALPLYITTTKIKWKEKIE